ncbi:MAG: biotin synthase [Campylobacterota bacterium]
MNNKSIMLCAINNIQSGSCDQDCKFCTQSVHNDTDIESYRLKDADRILRDAKAAKANKAVGFCLVTSGKAMSDKLCAFLCDLAPRIKKQVADFNLIGCNGLASLQQLRALKASGFDSYNHNLETSENFYAQICTTHDWKQRFETCQNVKRAGLNLCSGGIFGLGESSADRDALMDAIVQLDPKTVPINFFMPNAGLPLHPKPISASEALAVVKKLRSRLPHQKLMAAGGRELVFADDQKPLFDAGIDAIVIGDYLTAKGAQTKKDCAMVQEFGYGIARNCR